MITLSFWAWLNLATQRLAQLWGSMLSLSPLGFFIGCVFAALSAMALVSLLRRLFKNQRVGSANATNDLNQPAEPLYAQPSKPLLDQIGLFQDVAHNIPILVWQQQPGEPVTWANQTYIDLLGELRPGTDATTAPHPELFNLATGIVDPEKVTCRRLLISSPDRKKPRWFDVSTVNTGSSGLLHFALLANPVVQAEEALRNFVQTLTKTFAHLPIGLAIFDRDRQLALFNPALTDLTALKPEWLGQRPSLFSFLDHLRENRHMPKVKDYPSWRRNMVALEKAAEDGTFSQDWALPSGQTYRVTGRPHPEGAVAFLFENITAEVALQRRFRAELELCQSVIDNVHAAMIVFMAGGEVAMSNDAFADLWGFDPARSLAQPDVIATTQYWQSVCRPTPIWGDLREYVTQLQDRSEWYGDLYFLSGRKITGRFSPMSGGATLCTFTEDEELAEKLAPRALADISVTQSA